jgi:8-oxo-dGTP pyrophosphatase MutT (NUDIX family)
MNKPASASLRLASTMLVLRDGPQGMEVLMVRRAERQGDRSSGAFVFPGGTLDPQDRELTSLCHGLSESQAQSRLAVPADGLAHYVCGIRECFEEAGLLFAYRQDGSALNLQGLAPSDLTALRQALRQGSEGLKQLCERWDLRLAVDRLVYFSHWLTPLGLPKRFNARFFVVQAFEGQQALHDSVETMEHRWVRPVDALQPDSGIKLVHATGRTLESISGFANVQACLAHASAQTSIPCIFPRMATVAGVIRPVMPDHPAYETIGEQDPEGLGHVTLSLQEYVQGGGRA